MAHSLGNRPIPHVADIGRADFLALDFETATGYRDSACALGLAWVRDGRVVGHAHRLIRPPDNAYTPFTMAVHGITPDRTAHEPDFARVWREVAPHVAEGTPLLAHNAAFDMGVLRACLRAAGLPLPDAPHLCTVKVARRLWPTLPNHKLSTVARHLGVDLDHHHAGSDAVACAEIALAGLVMAGVADLTGLSRALSIAMGRFAPD